MFLISNSFNRYRNISYENIFCKIFLEKWQKFGHLKIIIFLSEIEENVQHSQNSSLKAFVTFRVELSIKTMRLECIYAFTYFSSERVKVIVSLIHLKANRSHLAVVSFATGES